MSTVSAGNANRIAGLDSLRGLASLAVASGHYTSVYGKIYGQPADLPFTLHCGREAVELFFIISGFVITMSLDRSKSVADFAVARLARLFPLFWASIWVTFAIVYVAGLPGRETSFGEAVINMSMMPSVLGARPVDVVYWTMTAELFFYLAIATVVAAGLRRQLPVIVSLLIIVGMFDAIYDIETILPFGGYRRTINA